MNSINASHFKWYVIYTYPNFEKKVQNSMLQRNITCFLPLQKTIRQWSDRKRIIETPLFPNYIFVYLTNEERFKILTISGASKYVTYNGGPAIVPEKEINAIKNLLLNQDVSAEHYLEGVPVRIIDGPFKDLTGTIFERKGKTRFGVKIEVINRSISVELNESSIKRTDLKSIVY